MSVRGGANYRLKITTFHFNFKSARGANYRKYGIQNQNYVKRASPLTAHFTSN